jgi:hypothetical protein
MQKRTIGRLGLRVLRWYWTLRGEVNKKTAVRAAVDRESCFILKRWKTDELSIFEAVTAIRVLILKK